jgi:sugar phosphate isomerase/epimerase
LPSRRWFWLNALVRFAICNETFKDWKLDATFDFCAQVGYDGVEVAPFTLGRHVTDISAAGRSAIRESAARAGIAISGIHWVLVQTEGMYLTSPDAATRDRTARYFCDLVDFCADIGGKVIVVGSPKQRNLLPGVTHEQAWAWATGVFRPSVLRAEERGVVICFEPLAPSETNFINTAEEGIRFARQFASPAMSVILDVKAMCSMGRPVPQIIRESRGAFGYFHANDANLKGPGFGDVDFKPIAAALRDAGYDGWASVEVFNYDEGPEVIATKSLEYLKRAFA